MLYCINKMSQVETLNAKKKIEAVDTRVLSSSRLQTQQEMLRESLLLNAAPLGMMRYKSRLWTSR